MNKRTVLWTLCLVTTLSLSGTMSIGADKQEAEELRAMQCLGAMADIGIEMRDNGDPELEIMMQDISLWKGRLTRYSMADAGNYGARLLNEKSHSEIYAMSQSCREEIRSITAASCASYANTASEEAVWRFKAAGTQAAIGVGTNGSLHYSEDHIKQGCETLRKAQSRMAENYCDQALIDSLAEMESNYVLDVPLQKGTRTLNCSGGSFRYY